MGLVIPSKIKAIGAFIIAAMAWGLYQLSKSVGVKSAKLETATKALEESKRSRKERYETEKHIKSLSDDDLDKLL